MSCAWGGRGEAGEGGKPALLRACRQGYRRCDGTSRLLRLARRSEAKRRRRKAKFASSDERRTWTSSYKLVMPISECSGLSQHRSCASDAKRRPLDSCCSTKTSRCGWKREREENKWVHLAAKFCSASRPCQSAAYSPGAGCLA